MNREQKERIEERLSNLRLTYKVTEEPWAKNRNAAALEELKAALDEVGVYLRVNDGELTLGLNGYKYYRRTTRNAGMKATKAVKPDRGSLYHYSDIVMMLQTMSDLQVMEKIEMNRRTYYRHKKTMTESEYYQALDPERLTDQAYLESVKGNYAF